jgi:probable HAF family extracellular repeat protein
MMVNSNGVPEMDANFFMEKIMKCVFAVKRKKSLLMWSLPCVFGTGIANAAAALPAPAEEAGLDGAKKCICAQTYHLVNLGSGELSTIPSINDSGQVAFSFYTPVNRALFYNGVFVQNIGHLGGNIAFAEDINQWGQIAGTSAYDGIGNLHAFAWSSVSGMIDLGTIGPAVHSHGYAINNFGQVAGYSQFIGPLLDPHHAFRWSFPGGMMDLGTLAGRGSVGKEINNAGAVTGYSDAAIGFAHAFIWRQASGMVDLGTLAGRDSYGDDINDAGQVAGGSIWQPAGFDYHAYFWPGAGALQDLGTLGGPGSGVWDMNDAGQVVGVADTAGGEQHAMSWTQAGGMRDLGTFGGTGSSAIAVNNKGQVVGWARDKLERYRAYAWSKGHALVDLSKRIKNPPAGIKLDSALAISDNGSIVATSNAGLVLLKPFAPKKLVAPMLGPITVADSVPSGKPVSLSLSFADIDAADKHSISWSWGDGSADEAGTVRQRKREAMGSHSYSAPGVYWVTATLTDSAGKSSSVSREVAVQDLDGGVVAASGWFLSPQGALAGAPHKAGLASFSFAPASEQQGRGPAQLQFSTGSLHFRSDSSAQLAGGGRGQYLGSGKVNGKAGYSFALTLVDGAAAGNEQDRFSLRISHTDPATGAQVVDYDNGVAGKGMLAGMGGSLISGGRIVVR